MRINLGKKVREARERAGYGLNELGRISGVSPSVISDIENSVGRPSYTTMDKLLRHLPLAAYELFNNSR